MVRGSGSLTSGVWAGSKGLAHTLFMMQSFLMHWVSTYTPRDDSPPAQSCVAQSLSDAELCDTKPCVLRAPTSLPQPQHPTDSPFWSRFSLFSSPFSPLWSLFGLFVDQNCENNAENGESPLMAACTEKSCYTPCLSLPHTSLLIQTINKNPRKPCFAIIRLF